MIRWMNFGQPTNASIGILAFLCCSIVFPTRVGRSQDIHVLSYNIRYLNQNDGKDIWSNRQSAVYKVIAKADVIGLQEVVWKQFEEIQAADDKLVWYGVGRDDGQQAGEAAPIGWRASKFECLEKGTFWLSPTPETTGSIGWDAALPRIASWVKLQSRSDHKIFYFLNTHFDHRGREARLNSAMVLRKWSRDHKAEAPIVLTGDLNARVDDEPLRALLDEKAGLLRDARNLALRADTGPASTWNGFRKIVDGQRIDFILVSPNIQVLAYQTLDPRTEAGRFASDHLPVSAIIKLEE